MTTRPHRTLGSNVFTRSSLCSVFITSFLTLFLAPVLVACAHPASDAYDAALQRLSATEDALMGVLGEEWIPRSKPNLVTCQTNKELRQIWSKHTGITNFAPAQSSENTKAVLEEHGYTIKNYFEWPGISAGNDSIMVEAVNHSGSYFKVETFADGFIAIFALSDCIQ